MDTLDQNIELESDKLRITNSIRENLLVTAKWARFLAIMGFIFTGIFGIFALVILISALSSGVPFFIGMGLGYLIAAIIMIFPGLYLIRFAVSIEKGLRSNKQGEFDYGIQSLKSLFKFIGIYTIVILSLYILAIIVGAGMGSMFR